MDNMQPGQVIVPRSSADSAQQPGGAPPAQVPDDVPELPVPSPVAAPEPTNPNVAPATVAAASPDGVVGQFYRPAETERPQFTDISVHDAITWTASEYIAHEKGAGWYVALVVGCLVAAVADYLLLKDKVSAVIIVLAAIGLPMVYARKPRTQQYALTTQGLQVGTKVYPLQDFKNFSVAEEGAIASIVLMPMKRFMPPLTVFVAPDMEDQIINFLGNILPLEQPRTAL